MKQKILTLKEIYNLSFEALVSCGSSSQNAKFMAASIEAAEADNLRNIGLDYLPLYCEQLKSGKIDGTAVPVLEQRSSGSIMVDANQGFAHPAIQLGMKALEKSVRENAIAAMGITNSSSAGVIGHLLEPLAKKGILLIGFANVSPLMVPWGGSRPVFGTNPIAAAIPSNHRPPVVIDFATSATAMVNIIKHAEKGIPLEPGWGVDKNGNPTLDGNAVLNGGALLPFGAHKGYALALLVEILAAGLTGANWSKDAPSFSEPAGAPQGIGQFFIALDPLLFGNGDFLDRVEELLLAISEQEGTMIPGNDRLDNRNKAHKKGVAVDDACLNKIQTYCERKCLFE